MAHQIEAGRSSPPAPETHSSHDGAYLLVYIALAFLTLVELIVTYMSVIKIPVLLMLAATKATLVAAFYMHLRYEQRFLSWVFLFPIVVALLGGLAILQLIPH